MIRVRVLRPVVNGKPLSNRHALKLLKAVAVRRPFACSNTAAEVAAWAAIDRQLGADLTAASTAEDLFWYLLGIYNRHRQQGAAVAGLRNSVLVALEKLVLCVETYGYKRWRKTDEVDNSVANEASVRPDPAMKTSPHEYDPDTAVAAVLSGVTEMKDAITRSREERAALASQLEILALTNEQLKHENEQLKLQVASLQKAMADQNPPIKTERPARDDEQTKARAQRLRVLLETMAELLAQPDETSH